MNPLKRILSVVGPRMEPSPATRRATELARRSGARLDLFMPVYDRDIDAAQNLTEPDVARRALEHFVDERSRWLTEFARELADRGLDVSGEVSWSREPYKAIIDRALDDSPDLVVADLKRDDFLHRWSTVRTTDWRLSRLCPVPLMLVQSASSATLHRVAAAIDPTHPGAHPSGLDDQVITVGLAMAKMLEEQLEVLHVFPYLSADASDKRELNTLAKRLRLEHENAFSSFADRHTIPRDHCKLLLGEPAESLAQHVASEQIDLLVIGSQYRSGLDRLLLGSHSEALIAQAPCDLLIVRPSGFADALKRDGDFRHLVREREKS